MDLNTQNGNNNNGIRLTGDATLSPNGQENISDSLLDTSEMGDEADLESMRKRIREMEEEAEKLKQMQLEVEKQMQLPGTPGTPTFPTIEEKMEADQRSVYVGNVDYSATAQELENHFHGCGSIHRVTILCDKFTGQPKGFAYVEFADKDSVQTGLALDDSLFKGRQIKVTEKRTNRPGVSTTDRPPRGALRGFGRGRFPRGTAFMPYIPASYRGRIARPFFRINMTTTPNEFLQFAKKMGLDEIKSTSLTPLPLSNNDNNNGCTLTGLSVLNNLCHLIEDIHKLKIENERLRAHLGLINQTENFLLKTEESNKLINQKQRKKMIRSTISIHDGEGDLYEEKSSTISPSNSLKIKQSGSSTQSLTSRERQGVDFINNHEDLSSMSGVDHDHSKMIDNNLGIQNKIEYCSFFCYYIFLLSGVPNLTNWNSRVRHAFKFSLRRKPTSQTSPLLIHTERIIPVINISNENDDDHVQDHINQKTKKKILTHTDNQRALTGEDTDQDDECIEFNRVHHKRELYRNHTINYSSHEQQDTSNLFHHSSLFDDDSSLSHKQSRIVPFNIQFCNIEKLSIRFPINEQFWFIIPTCSRLISLDILSSHPDEYCKRQLQALLDRAPHLSSLNIRDYWFSWPSEMIAFNKNIASIFQLNVLLSDVSYDNEQCIALCDAPLGTQCEVLSIRVTNRTCILDLINGMNKLRVLNVQCQDDQSIKNTVSDVDELINWLSEQQPSLYAISEIIRWGKTIHVWIR
ncbi:unnamed protein product [Rotaria sp. Silwood2]|nr:unnamed protein product [Rotaria sp. Silwood2]